MADASSRLRSRCEACYRRYQQAILLAKSQNAQLPAPLIHLSLPFEILTSIAEFTIPSYSITATFFHGHGLYESRIQMTGPPCFTQIAQVCKAFNTGIQKALRRQFNGILQLINHCNRDPSYYFLHHIYVLQLTWLLQRVTDLQIDGMFLPLRQPQIHFTSFSALRTLEFHQRGPFYHDIRDFRASLSESYRHCGDYFDDFLLVEILREARALRQDLVGPIPNSKIFQYIESLEQVILVRHYLMRVTHEERTKRQYTVFRIDLKTDKPTLLWQQARIAEGPVSNFAKED